ncbi:MAG: peptidoglycan DD-metalloendopeptidase family protein [Patescibacteria group bacterium]
MLKTTTLWSIVFLCIAVSGSVAFSVLVRKGSTLEEIYRVEGGLANGNDDFSFAVGRQGIGNGHATLEAMRFVSMDGSLLASLSPLTNMIASRNGLKRYTVQKKDTLAKIASQFNIDVATIKAANPGIRSGLRPGQQISILPVSGIVYDVVEGDTVESLALKFHMEPDLFRRYNPDFQKVLVTGRGTLILPNVKPDTSLIAKKEGALPDLKGYFSLPAKGWNWGELHEKNAVDIANKCGTEVYASADGVVVPDDKFGEGADGWNDGYGVFVLLEHPNGTRTRYAHLGRALVTVGEEVSQGTIVGVMGNTGNTHGPSGCHLHFEVLGAKNPFAIR